MFSWRCWRHDAANIFWLMDHLKGSESAKVAKPPRGGFWLTVQVLDGPAFLQRLPRGSVYREEQWRSVLLHESWLLANSCLLGRKLVIVDWKGVVKIDHVSMILFSYLQSKHLSFFSPESLILIYVYYRAGDSTFIYLILHILKSGFETSHFGSCICKNQICFLYYDLWRLIDIRRVILITCYFPQILRTVLI